MTTHFCLFTPAAIFRDSHRIRGCQHFGTRWIASRPASAYASNKTTASDKAVGDLKKFNPLSLEKLRNRPSVLDAPTRLSCVAARPIRSRNILRFRPPPPVRVSLSAVVQQNGGLYVLTNKQGSCMIGIVHICRVHFDSRNMLKKNTSRIVSLGNRVMLARRGTFWVGREGIEPDLLYKTVPRSRAFLSGLAIRV